MSDAPDRFSELRELLAVLDSGKLTDQQDARIEELVVADPAARRFYLEMMFLYGQLRWKHKQAGASDPRTMSEDELAALDNEPAGGEQVVDLPAGRQSPAAHSREAQTRNPRILPPLSPLHSPISPSLGYFSAGWPLAYLIATVIFGIGLMVGALVHVSQPDPIATRSAPGPSPLAPRPSADTEFVAWITGMVDCEWKESGFRAQGSATSNGKSEIIKQNSPLRLGDGLALRSGLLEITYDTGARVILQGPVTYEVESPSGGFLSVGKLTARLEQKSEVKGQRSESANHPSEIIHQKFAVRTPTAVVTDLGTEFGVEVDRQGRTQSHVFRGVVRVQTLGADGKPEGDAQMLRENESAQVDGSRHFSKTTVAPAATDRFIRVLPQRRIKTFDLVDVVAGGDGFSGRRDRGIDPTNGRPTDANAGYMTGDETYHRVEGLPFVDGVFIPHGRTDPVQIDSAGHTFADFGNAKNMTANCVWAGGVIPTNPPYAISTRLNKVDYARRGHGLLFMHSNKGITFDMNAIRAANPSYKLSRFRSTAGNSEIDSQDESAERGDLWVFVDGQVRFQHRKTNYYKGAIPIDIPIRDGDRFLTLAATDGGHPIEYNWILFGDPRLELVQTTSDAIRP